MSNFVSVKSYDGTIVRVPKDKLNEFNVRQQKIRDLLNRGKSLKEIKSLIEEGVL